MQATAKTLLQARRLESGFPKSGPSSPSQRPGRCCAHTSGSSAQVATFAKSCRYTSNPIPIRRNALEAAVGEPAAR
jgi:hypothetical protein